MITEEKVVFLHIPKTGGAAMEKFFYKQLDNKRNFFLSFFGHDDSKKYKDSLSTIKTNQCMIESIWYNSELQERLKNSAHFKQAKLLLGHTTYSIKDLFPEYTFKFITIIREPIERTTSNIAQLTRNKGYPQVRFGSYIIDHELYSDGYWNDISRILDKGLPVKGLLRHENCFLENGMCRVIQGDKYLSEHMSIDMDIIEENLQHICVAKYDDFNNTLQHCLDRYNIPIDMSLNTAASNGKPAPINTAKQKYGQNYNAPQKILDWVEKNNQLDINLYQKLI